MPLYVQVSMNIIQAQCIINSNKNIEWEQYVVNTYKHKKRRNEIQHNCMSVLMRNFGHLSDNTNPHTPMLL